METAAALAEELERGGDPREMIVQRRQDLRQLIAKFDAVHLLAQVQLGETLANPETYSESNTTGAVYIVELVAAELILRPRRDGEFDYTPPIDANVLVPIRKLIREVTFLEALRRGRSIGVSESPEGMARWRATAAHLMQRGPSWPWQEHETIRGLFGPARFAEKLRSELGFDAEDAISCCSAAVDLVNSRAVADREPLNRAIAEFKPGSAAYEWAERCFGNSWKEGPPEFRARAMAAIWWLNHVGDALLIDASSLSEAAGVTESSAARFLDALSSPMGLDEDDWFSMAERVRFRPYLEFEPGLYYLSVPGNDLWALRGVFEEALKGASYYKHRGSWLERRARDLLIRALQPDEAHLDVGYDYQVAGQTRNGDIDVLIRCGDAALLIEAKSATLRPGARRGGDALISHLQENISKASDQASRATQALNDQVKLRIDGQESLLGEAIREVHPIIVTLDDLSSVATVLWQLEGGRAMPKGVAVPWLVNIHELELVCETVEHPASLIHFLRRRARLNQIGRYHAHDELDWWMHYLTYGLYFEDQAADETLRFGSLTDPLDAWVQYKHGLRETPAAKPALGLDDQTARALRFLASERGSGWLAASCLLLEPSGKARRRLWTNIEAHRRRTVQRGRPQRSVMGFTERLEPMLITCVVAPDGARQHLQDLIEDHVDEQLSKYGEQAVLALGMAASSPRPFDAYLVIERGWWNIS